MQNSARTQGGRPGSNRAESARSVAAPRFQHHSEIKVRWRDIDALGHVNSAVYFTYFETARVEYLDRAFPGRDFEVHLASSTCDFFLPLRKGDVVNVGVRIPWVGRTSFAFEYEIRRAGDAERVVATGSSVQVLFESGGGAKRPITADWRKAVASVEGRTPRTKRGSTRST